MSENACGGASSSSTDTDKDSSVECPTCGRTDFASDRGMRLHHAKAHGESIAGVGVCCDSCGESFRKPEQRANNHEHHYCSKACHNNHIALRGERGELEKPDHLTPMYGEDNPAWKGGKASIECDLCGVEFERPPCEVDMYDHNFCSSDCRVEWMKERMAGENHPQWKGGHENYYGANWLRQRRKALDRDNYTCQRCQTHQDSLDRSLEVHHLKRIAWFKKNYDKPEWFERGNDLKNLISLCRDCHNKWEGIPLRPQSD